MPKKKERSGEEHWRGICREQASEIRHLQKRIRELEKHTRAQDEEIDTSSEDTMTELPHFEKCTDCGKGVLEEFEIAGKVIGTCNVCGHRKRIR